MTDIEMILQLHVYVGIYFEISDPISFSLCNSK